MTEKILIVDDEPDMLKLLEVIITDKTDYNVTTTSNPLEVPGLIAGGDFDLVITDLRMPEKDGMEIIEEAQKSGLEIPFVVITAYGTIESAVEAMKNGAFDYITKPFRKEHILLTIERVMRYRRLQKENIRLRKEASQPSGTPS
ncbi:MAG: response regulator [Thermodesulfobacteriota bacterium]|nr:response regulator [Thermodesulfobacteriota bacterium]